MLVAGLGAALALLAVVALLLHAAGRARARALADDVRTKVEPYVRRKAAEAGIPADAPTWTSRSHPEEMVAYTATLARRLLERERTGPQADDGVEFAKTMPAQQPVVTNDLKPRRR